jgi:hypothetical protein
MQLNRIAAWIKNSDLPIRFKGQSACKGGNHACKGLNACKGQGFAEITKAECVAAKGKFKAS